ncbi:uncharacterized mitochondrial protein AtMg01250-like [Primulina huaijiensis]|uniref:uncharacterized mitochondrial protein AtMg01250-like n=1 Tax=Primulina huaijiensis TaxID=1492673 RepID=UPI003CC6FD52
MHVESGFQKTYDTVDRDFIREVLTFLNFPCRFVRWVMECVATTSYSIVINCQYHGLFDGKRGLRQDDPLSPFLFTLCLETLSRALNRMTQSPSFGFHPKFQYMRIAHLAYEDDLLLLSRGDVASVSMVIGA